MSDAWSFVDEMTGLFTGHRIEGSPEMVAGVEIPPGVRLMRGAFDHLSQRVDLETGEVIDYQPPKPDGDALTAHEWDEETRRWLPVPTLEGLERRAIQALAAERDARLEGGFVWDGSRFDSDTEKSQPRLLGLYTRALAGAHPPEGRAWRLADNSWRVLSSEDAIAVWEAFEQHMAGLFAAFAAHEAAIGALAEAGDAEGLRAYDTGAGWP